MNAQWMSNNSRFNVNVHTLHANCMIIARNERLFREKQIIFVVFVRKIESATQSIRGSRKVLTRISEEGFTLDGTRRLILFPYVVNIIIMLMSAFTS